MRTPIRKQCVLVLVLVCLLCITANSNDALETNLPSLRGIVKWPGHTKALIERIEGPFRLRERYLLAAGERERDLQVKEVLPDAAIVRMTTSAGAIELQLQKPTGTENTNSSACSIQLEKAPLDLVLSIYEKIADRTLLRPTQLQECDITLPRTCTDKRFRLLRALDQALGENEIVIQPHLDKFALVGRSETDFAKVKPELFDTVAGFCRQSTELLGPGMINFPRTELDQVLKVYQELAGRTIIRPTALPAPQIHLRNQTETSRVEASYACRGHGVEWN